MGFWFGRTLTFEILSDEAAPTVGYIAQDVTDGCIAGEAVEVVHGYAAYGATRRSAVQPLTDHFAMSLFDDGEQLRRSDAYVGGPLSHELGCDAGGGTAPVSERSQAVVSALPRSLALQYYDPARDYQTGQMRASAAVTSGLDQVQELPVAIDAAQAKALAEAHIARRWAERDRLVFRLPPAWLSLKPGSIMEVDGALWRTEQVTLEDLVVRVELSPVSEAIESALADSGSHLPAPDVVAAPTVLAILDLPDLGIGRHDVPVLHVAACQPLAGWRQVPLEVTVGGEVIAIASARGEAIIGTALSVLADGSTAGFDDTNFLEVELADGEHWLESRDDAALGNGANLAVVETEVIQFGRAIATGPGCFRLEHLLRGRFGSEWAMQSHGPNEKFVLIRPGALQEIPLPLSAIGSQISIRPLGLADEDVAPIESMVTGEAMRPPSPVDLRAEVLADGAMSLGWTRRSRLGWNWPGQEPPLGENSERYRVTVEGSAATLKVQVQEPAVLLSADSLIGMTGPVTITVAQLGDFAESRPLIATIEI